ncbi:hypothetical protein D3C78_1368180 [compost metagenome]
MAILTQAILGNRRLEETPLPERRQRLALRRRRLAEGGGDAADQVEAQLVVDFFAPADPGRQIDFAHRCSPWLRCFQHDCQSMSDL